MLEDTDALEGKDGGEKNPGRPFSPDDTEGDDMLSEIDAALEEDEREEGYSGGRGDGSEQGDDWSW